MLTLLELPLTEERVRSLHVGDEVRLFGRLFTAREGAHRQLLLWEDARARSMLSGRALYHSSPVVVADPMTGAYRVVAAGPSDSARVEEFAPQVVSRFGVRALLGKGGMGKPTSLALNRYGAVYLHVPSSLAVTLARAVTAVHGVHFLDELGVAEALWDLEVNDLPAVVTMDAHGESLHDFTSQA